MTVAVAILAGLMFVTIAGQALLIAIHIGALKKVRRSSSNRTYQPRAVVVLCLRGTDPSLRECLRGLVGQAYSRYRVLAVLDHESDPAGGVVREPEFMPHIETIVADLPDGRCSLKCNALLSALRRIDSTDCEVIALVDADCVVDRDWLADLVAPLADEPVGVSTGNRWFTPEDCNTGTLVRYIWHLGASVQMFVYRIPWGGSVAFRRSFVEIADLPSIWSRTLFDDTLLAPLAWKHGLRTVAVAGLLVPSEESTDVRGAFVWIRRQLLNTRLYHPAFPLTAIHSLGTTVLLVAAAIVLVTCAGGGLWGLAATTFGLIVTYGLFWAVTLNRLESRAGGVVRCRHADLPGAPPLSARLLVAVLITQFVYAAATLGAMFIRLVRWRGATYRIAGPRDIQMTGNDPPRSSDTLSPNSIEF